MSLPRRLRAGLLTLAAVGALVVPIAVAAPVAAADYPSWADVQSARQDQAATAAMIDTLQASLDDAQTRATTLSSAALDAAAAAGAARDAADAAAAHADDMAARSAAADDAERTLRGQLGTLAGGLYRSRSEGALTARLLTASDPERLLDRLGLLDRLTTTWADLLGQTRLAADAAQALRLQSADAAAARESAAAEAATTAQAAQAAADAEAASLAAIESQMGTLYEQLATLKRTTADTERAYRLGREAEQQVTGPGSGGTGGTSAGPGGGSNTGGGENAPGSDGGSGSTPPPTYGVVVDPEGAKAYARSAMASRYGWGEDQYQCLVLLWNRESGWRADALNRSSGAYGIPQALPAEKMASAGADWRTNGATQVDWGMSYIRARYGTPCGAWAHSQSTGWY